MDSSLYDVFYELETKHWWFIARSRILLDLLERYSHHNQNIKLLDIGCGTGFMLQCFHQRFGKVYGLDCSPLAVEYTNRRMAKEGVVAFLGALPNAIPFPDETFDVVTLLDVLEHFDEDQQALQVIFRLLKAGGIFVCTVPACPFLWSEHDDLNHHRRRYILLELKQKLADVGFFIEKISYYNTLLFPPIAFIRILQRLRHQGIPKSDFKLPPKFLNHLLQFLFGCEKFLMRFFTLPFGVSLLVVARKWQKKER